VPRPASPGTVPLETILVLAAVTAIGQFIALALVLGSYVGAQYMRVWRPRRRGERVARRAEAAPRPERSGEPAAAILPAPN
jgi:hypothetical protein